MNSFKKISLLAAIAAAAFSLGGNAFAAACTLGGTLTSSSLGGASTADASLSLNGGPATDADACQISNAGNGGNTNGTLLGATFGGDSFTRIAKLGEKPDAAFLGISFALTATGTGSGGTDGTWTLSWTGGPANLDLVLAIHASNRSGLFFFDDRELVAGSNGTGTWEINWMGAGNSGKPPGFSNMTVWARQGDGCTPGTPGCGDVPGPSPVPEPASLALLGLGAIGVGVFGRRRRED